MSDELNATPAVAESPEKKPGLLATPGGKIVAIIVGLGVLGMIAGVAVAIVLYVFGSQAVDEIESQLQTPGTTETPATPAGTVVPVAEAPAAEVANSEVFTFRNIFIPLLKPLPDQAGAAADGTGSTTTTDTVTPTSGSTLYLNGVVTQNSVLMAQLRYNGTDYTLGPGGVIPNSPWEVLRVFPTSVTMLYGENQVTLSVGQGITK